MRKIAVVIVLLSLISCWKNNKEEEQYYAQDNTPIDSTLVDSVVGQTSFLAINSAIANSQKKDSILPKKDTAKTPAEKLAEAKKKLEDKKKSESDKKIADQKAKEDAAKSAEKEKQQQEKKVDELIQTPEN